MKLEFWSNCIIPTSSNCCRSSRKIINFILFFSICIGMFFNCFRRRENYHIIKLGISPFKLCSLWPICIAKDIFTGIWSLRTCFNIMVLSNWQILDWQGKSGLNHLLLSMCPLGGTGLLRPCLEEGTTTRPWTFSLLELLLHSCTLEFHCSLGQLKETK